MAVFVNVGKDDAGIVFEAVKNSVSVVGVDIHVPDALESRALAQQLYGNATVVEYAKSRRLVACSMMQAGDRHERATALTGHDRFGGVQRGADNHGRGVVHPSERRRVAGVEETLSRR